MRKFHLPIFLITLLAIATWTYIYLRISPWQGDDYNLVALGLFFITAGTSITGTYTLGAYLLKSFLYPSWDARFITRVSLRQGVILGGGGIFLGFLTLIGSLNWMTGSLTVISLLSLEIFFRR